MRKTGQVRLRIYSGKEESEVSVKGGESILEMLQRRHRGYGAVCGRNGRCGKCRIRLIRGDIAPSEADRHFFTEEELEQGFRLACQAFPEDDCELELCFGPDLEMESITKGLERTEESAGGENSGKKGYGIALDLGTTTLAAQLLDLDSGKALATALSVNHQREYGADVVSRIQASLQGAGSKLQTTVHRDISELICVLQSQVREEKGFEAVPLKKLCISGNTVMEHLFLGYSCKGMEQFPFCPVSLEKAAVPAKELFQAGLNEAGDFRDLEIILLPGISAFVGADIAAGILACGMHRSGELCLFMDLGTNGEMALGNQDGFLVTSMAAGPAFEGGSILWGTGSVPGAVCHVDIGEDGRAEVKTIGNGPPCGICGTGVIEAAGELFRCGILDETGRLDSPYAERGYPLARTSRGETIVLTQKDIRELQLAKAAVRAGMEVLLKKRGTDYKGVGRICLAGGFGNGIDEEKAARLGLWPKEFAGRIEIVGNASLEGAKRCVLEEAAWDELEEIRKMSCEVPLASEKEFQELYLDCLSFGG